MQKYPEHVRVSVVIPTLNEAKNLPHVLPYIPELASEVILVDGGSHDGTTGVARRLLPSIRILQQPGKGKGNALCYAFAACTGDIIVTLDADGSANPREIPRFVDALLEGADLAKGSRFIARGGSDDITPLRKLGNSGLTGLVNRLYRTDFTDLCYGYNAFWQHWLDLFEVDCSGFEVEALICVRARMARLKIVEVPSHEHLRIHGTSNLHWFRDGCRVLKTIVKERMSGYCATADRYYRHVHALPPAALPLRRERMAAW